MIGTVKREWKSIVLTAVATALITVVAVFAVAALLAGPQNALASRVDRNAQVARAGIDSVVCILNIRPHNRTNDNIRECMKDHGYDVYFTGTVGGK